MENEVISSNQQYMSNEYSFPTCIYIHTHLCKYTCKYIRKQTAIDPSKLVK